MPARLADGLGLESGLGFCCQKSCAPSPKTEELWVPRTGSEEALPV